MNCSVSGSSIHGILQARILEWTALSFSRGSSWPRDWTPVSRIVGRCFTIWATRLTVKRLTLLFSGNHKALFDLMIILQVDITAMANCVVIPSSECVSCSVMSDSLWPHGLGLWKSPWMGFSRQEYWSGLPFPSPGYLPNPGINLGLPHCR